MITHRLSTILLIFTLTIVANAQDGPSEAAATSSRKDDFVNAPIQYRAAGTHKFSKEAKAALEAPADLKLAHKDFLKQKNTGLAKLLPRKEKNDGMLVSANRPEVFIPTRYGGASYSFSNRKHDDDSGVEILLDKDIHFYPPGTAFHAGTAGADLGFMTKLGDIAIEDVTVDRKEAKFLADFVPPSQESEARAQQRINLLGFKVNGMFYRTNVPAEENTTYLLRTIRYNRADVLVAFRTIRKESDGSFVLLWKILKKNPIPILKKKPCYFGPCG
jgi:hypothetical protein